MVFLFTTILVQVHKGLRHERTGMLKDQLEVWVQVRGSGCDA